MAGGHQVQTAGDGHDGGMTGGGRIYTRSGRGGRRHDAPAADAAVTAPPPTPRVAATPAPPAVGEFRQGNAVGGAGSGAAAGHDTGTRPHSAAGKHGERTSGSGECGAESQHPRATHDG